MVSLDVVSLFIRVPTNETLTLVWDKLVEDPLLKECTCILIDNLMEMWTFCMKMTYFWMGSDIYQLEEGLAMGLPLSPVLANVYIEYFKEMALVSTSLAPSMWLRYREIHSFSGLIRKMFKQNWIIWTQSDHLYCWLWRKNKTKNYPSYVN